MQKHRTTVVTIEEIGASGDGIGMVDGKKIFIPGGLPGEEVTARILSVHKDHIKAELLEIHTASKQRQTPPCRYFSRCGGCSLQHMQEESYYAFKQHIVSTSIKRAGFEGAAIKPLVSVGEGGRRRVTFKVQRQKGKVQLGYYEEYSRHVVDIEQCLIVENVIAQLILPLKNSVATLPVDEIAVTLTDAGLDVVCIGQNEPELTVIETLGSFREAHDIARISWKSPTGIIPIAQARPVVMVLGGVEVELPVGSFMQASRQGQAAITQEIITATRGVARIIDFYAGCGAYSFPMAEYASVMAVEGDLSMVGAVRQAANRAGVSVKLKVEQRDLFASPVRADELKAYDAAVINPPRNGASTQVEEIAASLIPNVVMVSCNPATFARDARILKAGGYRLDSVVGIDQFYLSSHLEIVGVFSK